MCICMRLYKSIRFMHQNRYIIYMCTTLTTLTSAIFIVLLDFPLKCSYTPVDAHFLDHL